MTTASKTDAERIVNQTVVLELTIKKPTFRASVPPANIMDESDKADVALFHVNKQLIDRAALSEINTHKSAFLAWLTARRVPCGHVLGSGMHLVPLRLVEEIDTAVRRFTTERAVLVGKLLADYDALIAEARVRLAGHFRADEYPAVEELRTAFGVHARFLSLNVPAALEQINRDLYAREQKRVEAEWTEAAGEVRSALREGFAKLVDNLAERLTPGDDGKAKTFQASTVDNLTGFLSTFADRDITQDTELAALVRQAKDLLAGADPKTLRTQESTRDRVLAGFGDVIATLNVLGVQAVSRRIATADEEV